MLLSVISEVVWKYYQDGKASAVNQKLSQADVMQMCRVAAANNFRQQYLFGQKVIPGRRMMAPPDEPEYYFLSPLLSIKRFELGEPDAIGIRKVDMSEFDLYRMPKNAHFTNLYPVNNECDGQVYGDAKQIKNGEEAYYAKPKFKGFLFYTITNRTANTVNFPPCVKSVDIETTYDSPTIDISLDIAFDVSNEVLGLIFRVADDDMKIKMQEELKKREDIK